MPTNYIVRLEHARLHPGVVVMREVVTGEVLAQFAATATADLLGKRTFAYWRATRTANAWEFGEEIPREQVEDATR